MSMLKEFRAFAMKGNVVDLAVGIIIGAAFGQIVSSMVNDVLMPPIGLLVGGINFTDIKIVLKDAVADPATGKIIREAVCLKAGHFIQTLVDFTIIAFSVFLMVKGINHLSRNKETDTAPPPAPEMTTDQELLTEIRDLLKK
jgi:large conductance mechanosensitive channel